MASKKVVVILPPRGVDEEEFRIVRGTLERHGHSVATASVFAGSVEAADGTSLPVDMRLFDIKTYQYDGYVFLGGEGVKALIGHPQVTKLVKDVSYKTIGASAEAVALVAAAGGLSKKKVTAPAEWMDVLRRNGAVFTGRPLQKDGKIVTVQSGSSAEMFANAVAEALDG
jgi:protease I